MNSLAVFPKNRLTLPTTAVRPLAKTHKNAIAQEYVQRFGTLTGSWEGAEHMFHAIDHCNGFPRQNYQVRPRESRLNAETVSKDFDTMYTTLNDDLQHVCDDLYAGVQSCFAYLRDQDRVGEIKWVSQDAVAYCYFMQRSFVNALGRTGDFLNFERTTEHVGYVHELMNAKRLHMNAPIAMPQRVKNLLQFVPTWLQKHIYIVDGTLIREVQVAKVKKETFQEYSPLPVYNYDPAVCFEHYVLTGWHPNEV